MVQEGKACPQALATVKAAMNTTDIGMHSIITPKSIEVSTMATAWLQTKKRNSLVPIVLFSDYPKLDLFDSAAQLCLTAGRGNQRSRDLSQ